MASVSFAAVILTLAADQTKSLVINTVSQRDPQAQTPGAERMYGNGRYVGLNAGATQQQHVVTFQALDLATREQLSAWTGQLLCYRDDTGAKYWGRYRNPQIGGRSSDTRADVTITFVELTNSDVL